MKVDIRFNFGNVANVYQTIELVEGYTESELLEGLNSGDIITSIGSDGDVLNLCNMDKVGNVIYTTIEHDLPYMEFELDTDIIPEED